MKTNRERARLCWIEMSLGNIARPGNGDLVEEIIERALDEAVREAVEAEREACAKVASDECNRYMASGDAKRGSAAITIKNAIRARSGE